MSDTKAEELDQNIQNSPKWNAPCVFKRLDKIPLDSKACFKTYDELQAYVDSNQSTAYPGMYVAVTSKDDPKAGPYIIMSDGESLVPVKIDGKITGVSLVGDDESKIDAEINEDGNANLNVDDVEIERFTIDNLKINEVSIVDLIPNLDDLLNLKEIEIPDEEQDSGIGFTLVQVATLLNQLIEKLKDSTYPIVEAKHQALFDVIEENNFDEEIENN